MMKKVLYGVALALLAIVSVGSLQSCKDDVNDLRTQTSYDLSKVRYDLSQLDLRVTQNAADIARKADKDYVDGLIGDLKTADAQLWQELNGALSRITDLESQQFATEAYVDGKVGALQAEIDALEAKYNEVKETLDAIRTELNGIHDDIAALDERVTKLEEALDNIIEDLDKRVSGILIQGVYSPVFGDFRLPIGIKSNMLFNWYGVNNNGDIEFPAKGVDVKGNALKLPAGLTVAEPFKVGDGEVFGDAVVEGNNAVTLGTVYATINPVGVKFDHLEITIENSGAEAAPLLPITLKPSDKVLYHGYTRADEETAEGEETEGVEGNRVNGFYEGEVQVSVDDIESIEYKIEDGLKASIKDAIKDPSKMTAKALVKAVYDQLAGQVPAYALRYDWTAPAASLEEGMDADFSMKAYAVLSQYDLAVATAKPLSYNFLSDLSGNIQLPTVGNIQNLIDRIKNSGALKFELSDVEFGEIKINLDEIQVNVTSDASNLLITIPNVYIKDNTGTQTPVTLVLSTKDEEPTTAAEWAALLGDKYVAGTDYQFSHIDGLNDVQNAIKEGIETALGSANTQIKDAIADIQNQLNDVIKSINEQISAKINGVIDNASNKLEPYFGKINKAFDLYNKVANKVNNFIKHPNNYLQVCAFYDMGGAQYGIASGKASDPTYAESGDFKLFLSSYTGELIVPACKKYVAITAIDGKTDGIAAANTGELNTVLDGNQIEVNVEGLASGKTYEFTYMALDYHGYTSVKKFYIKVK